MTHFHLYLSIVFLSITLSACSVKKVAQTPQAQPTLQALQKLMTGSFDSSAQAEQDTNFYNISLQMYPIWKDRPGTWLYVEQALASMPEKPYRQRVYKLEKGKEGTYISRVYTLKYEKEMVGQWKNPIVFDKYGPDMLREREGCAVYLKATGMDTFSGSTNESDCSSTLRGASYATSKVDIFKDKIVSWDQGFDSEGKQVWGATTGGYVFDRIKSN